MPSTRKYAPVVIEEDMRSDSESVSSISSTSSSPPKAVRFPDQAEIVTGVTRPLSPTEAWSLYYFETHARTCPACNDPYHVILKGGRLCNAGHELAYDVAMHVYHKNGIVYSTMQEKARDIRVEVPHGYDRLLALLKGMDRKGRRTSRGTPIISYEPRRYPSVLVAPAVESIREEDIPTSPVFVQPYRPEVERRRSHYKTHPKTLQYRTTVAGNDEHDDYERPRRSHKDGEKRGALYNDTKPRKEFRIEVRQPSKHETRALRKEYYC